MTDWRKSLGHLLFLKEFREPRNIDDLPTGIGGIHWKVLLREEPKTAIQRFLDSGALVSASLSERLYLKFKVTELEDMLRNRGLSPSGRNKQDLILRLIQTHPEDMKQAVMDLTLLKCSEQGEKIVEHFLTTEGEPHIRDDMSAAEKAKIVAKWVLAAAGAGVLGNAAYDALKRLAEAKVPAAGLFTELPKSFHNPHEYNAEYILIPGGRHRYQGKTEKEVPNVYFAKYPVTNKRYRRFIHYLEEKEHGLLRILPKGEFDMRMIEFASGINGFTEYLGNKPNDWPEKLRSKYDTDKRFASENQPVMNVSWFAARAYCCWLSALEEAGRDSASGGAGGLYRLPTEIEWEWAAGGGSRKYPWVPEKGPPTDKLANYHNKVGATTPVGRYPEGATPEGLMDMAGNVWEWLENWREGYKNRARSLRGGSWFSIVNYLLCFSRGRNAPGVRSLDFGFRVVRSQS